MTGQLAMSVTLREIHLPMNALVPVRPSSSFPPPFSPTGLGDVTLSTEGFATFSLLRF